jgi:hypothetical protein
MPVDYAKQLEKNTLDMQLYKSELQKHEGEVPLYTAPDGGRTILIGLGCAILGFVIGSLAR